MYFNYFRSKVKIFTFNKYLECFIECVPNHFRSRHPTCCLSCQTSLPSSVACTTTTSQNLAALHLHRSLYLHSDGMGHILRARAGFESWYWALNRLNATTFLFLQTAFPKKHQVDWARATFYLDKSPSVTFWFSSWPIFSL
jgi:hypothetical protein